MSDKQSEPPSKWQPVMVVADQRIECDECGALAIFVLLDDEEPGEEGERNFAYSAYCQDCFTRLQDEEEA